MSEFNTRPKANWTVLQPGFEVSDKGCLKIGRSMIMPKDLETILGVDHEAFANMCRFALEQNQAVKRQQEKAKYAERLMATAGKLGADKNATVQALEEFLAKLKQNA